MALDTDVVGCHGYYSDFSRTFHAGPDAPTAEQRRLYRLAHEQVHHNMGILRPGMTFRELTEIAYEAIPDDEDVEPDSDRCVAISTRSSVRRPDSSAAPPAAPPSAPPSVSGGAHT